MAKFKIIVIAHQLKGKKIAKANDIVEESELTSDSKDLVKKGFIVPVEDTDEEKAAAQKEQQAIDDAAKLAKEASEKLVLQKEAEIQKENQEKASELEVVDPVIIEVENSAATNAANKLKGKANPKK